MRKFLLVFSLISIVALAACSAATQVPLANTQAVNTPTAAAPTAAPGNTQPPALPPLATSEPVTCVAMGLLPTPSATETSLFPAVNAQDNKLGPDGAAVVFLEYSDFT